jgi:HYPK UBA domain
MTSLAGGSKSKKADEPSKKVVLKKEDVTVIVFILFILNLMLQMTEFDISKTAAEKALRQNHGELIPTINKLINA